MGENTGNDSHSRESIERISDWQLILVFLHMLIPLSHASLSLLLLNVSIMQQEVSDGF